MRNDIEKSFFISGLVLVPLVSFVMYMAGLKLLWTLPLYIWSKQTLKAKFTPYLEALGFALVMNIYRWQLGSVSSFLTWIEVITIFGTITTSALFALEERSFPVRFFHSSIFAVISVLGFALVCSSQPEGSLELKEELAEAFSQLGISEGILQSAATVMKRQALSMASIAFSFTAIIGELVIARRNQGFDERTARWKTPLAFPLVALVGTLVLIVSLIIKQEVLTTIGANALSWSLYALSFPGASIAAWMMKGKSRALFTAWLVSMLLPPLFAIATLIFALLGLIDAFVDLRKLWGATLNPPQP